MYEFDTTVLNEQISSQMDKILFVINAPKNLIWSNDTQFLEEKSNN